MHRHAALLAAALAAAPLAAQDLAVHVPMRDGVRLAIDVHLPKDRGDRRVPALLELTRYWRSRENRQGEPVVRLDPLDQLFLAHGYALVKVDVRGTGASFGARTAEYGPDEVQDGHAILDWVSKQEWCDGKLGAYGVSYSGTTAELLCAARHPALRAVVVGWSDFDIYRSPARPYGLFTASLIQQWSALVSGLDRNDAGRSGASVRRVAADRDGSLLAAAVAGHERNLDVAAAVAAMEFRDQPPPGGTVPMAHCSSPHWRRRIEASNVPMLVFASWFDSGTAAGALLRLQHYRNPQHVVILACSHGGAQDSSPYRKSDGEPALDLQAQAQLRLDFLDHHLRAPNTAVAEWPALRYWQLGAERLCTAACWPPPGTTPRTFHLATAGQLAAAPPDRDGHVDHGVDFGVGTGRANRWATQLGTPVLGLDHRERLAARMLVWDSAPLAADLDVTGTPVVHLWCEFDRDDAAVLAYLEDVDDSGRSRYVTEGGLRAVHRKLSADADFATAPFHSFATADALPLVPGERVELAFELHPVAVRIAAGHRLRLAVAGADHDAFARVPATGALRLRLHHGPSAPSRLVLPVATR